MQTKSVKKLLLGTASVFWCHANSLAVCVIFANEAGITCPGAYLQHSGFYSTLTIQQTGGEVSSDTLHLETARGLSPILSATITTGIWYILETVTIPAVDFDWC